MLTTKVTLAKLTADLVTIQALTGDWKEALHPRASDGRFGSKAGPADVVDAAGKAAGAVGTNLKDKALSALPGPVQTYARRLLKQPDPKAGAQGLLDRAQAHPGTVATIALTAALFVVGANPKVAKDLMKLSKEAFAAGAEAAKAEGKVSQATAKTAAKATKPSLKKVPKMSAFKDLVMETKELATGAMGSVRKSRDNSTVYKFFKKEVYGGSNSLVYSKKNEIILSHRAGELGVGPKVTSHSDEGYGMEFLSDHKTMRETLENSSKDSEAATKAMHGLVDQLGVLHRNGMAHRDLHLANAMVGPDGSVKIIDYGLALTDDIKVPMLAKKVDIHHDYDLGGAMSKDIDMIMMDSLGSLVNANAARIRQSVKSGYMIDSQSFMVNMRDSMIKEMREIAKVGDGNLSDPQVATRVKDAITAQFKPEVLERHFDQVAKGYNSLHGAKLIKAAKEKEKMDSLTDLMAKRKGLQRQYLETPTAELEKELAALNDQILFNSKSPTVDEAYALLAH